MIAMYPNQAIETGLSVHHRLVHKEIAHEKTPSRASSAVAMADWQMTDADGKQQLSDDDTTTYDGEDESTPKKRKSSPSTRDCGSPGVQAQLSKPPASPRAAAEAATTEATQPLIASSSAILDKFLMETKKTEVPPSTEGCEQCTPLDVLSGRGGRINHHPGNVYFRKIVKSHSMAYEALGVRAKPMVTRKIVAMIRQRGGKFLRFDEKAQLFFEVGDESARDKTSQSLRSVTFVKRRDGRIDQGRKKIRKRDADLSKAKKSKKALSTETDDRSDTRQKQEQEQEGQHVPRKQDAREMTGTVETGLTIQASASASPASAGMVDVKHVSNLSSMPSSSRLPALERQAELEQFAQRQLQKQQQKQQLQQQQQKREIRVSEQPDDPEDVRSLLVLAEDYRAQAAALEAKALTLRRLHARQQALDSAHPSTQGVASIASSPNASIQLLTQSNILQSPTHSLSAFPGVALPPAAATSTIPGTHHLPSLLSPTSSLYGQMMSQGSPSLQYRQQHPPVAGIHVMEQVPPQFLTHSHTMFPLPHAAISQTPMFLGLNHHAEVSRPHPNIPYFNTSTSSSSSSSSSNNC